MFGFGSKKKRTKLISASEKGNAGLLLYQCPECNQMVGAFMKLEGRSIKNLRKELEIKCSSCGKDIIVENDK